VEFVAPLSSILFKSISSVRTSFDVDFSVTMNCEPYPSAAAAKAALQLCHTEAMPCIKDIARTRSFLSLFSDAVM